MQLAWMPVIHFHGTDDEYLRFKGGKGTTATPIFPAQIHDAKAAIRWVRANAKKYHVDPDRIGVTGGSAGGHLSLLVGLTDPASNLEGNSGNPDQSSRVQAVVNVFGPTDMAFCYEKSSVAWIFTATKTLLCQSSKQGCLTTR